MGGRWEIQVERQMTPPGQAFQGAGAVWAEAAVWLSPRPAGLEIQKKRTKNLN